MKVIFYMVLVLFATTTHASLINADRSSFCRVSNGWDLKVDYYWDGHPQGPGRLNGIAQLNGWGKFPVSVQADGTDLTGGNSSGPDRLSSIDLRFSISNKTLEMREMLPIGNYTPWIKYSLSCK